MPVVSTRDVEHCRWGTVCRVEAECRFHPGRRPRLERHDAVRDHEVLPDAEHRAAGDTRHDVHASLFGQSAVLADAGEHPDRAQPGSHGITTPTCHLPKVVLKPVASAERPAEQARPCRRSVSRLETKYYTLAEMLKDTGYATGHFGKWHLGPRAVLAAGAWLRCRRAAHPGPGPAGSYVAPWKFTDFDPDPRSRRAHRRPHGQGSRRVHGAAQGRAVLPELLDVQRPRSVRRQARR